MLQYISLLFLTWHTFGSTYVAITNGNCASHGYEDIMDVTECKSAAVETGITSESSNSPHSQSENDRPHGCRRQTFGPPLWINNKPNSPTMASTVHTVVCKSMEASVIPAPPSGSGVDCYLYIDQTVLEECDDWNKPVNTWWNGGHSSDAGDPCDTGRINWWGYGFWMRCLKESGFPYPGYAIQRVNDHAAIYTTMGDSRFDINTPPPSPFGECYVYYDEDTMGACDSFPVGRTKVWFESSFGTQTCEQRAKWYSGGYWHGCWNNDPSKSGLPYPANKLVKVNDYSYVITAFDDIFDKQNPPPVGQPIISGNSNRVEGFYCYIYYDEEENGPCQLFAGGRPGNVWFDGGWGDQTCEERVGWWSGQTWHQCMKGMDLPYPGVDVVKVRDDAYIISKMTDFCPNDPDKEEAGACGCGVPDTDTDADGKADCVDPCPESLKDGPGVCGCAVEDTDTDGDGVPDCVDECPNDPLKTAPGDCGCGTADFDLDNNGVIDCSDLNAVMIANHEVNHKKTTVSFGKSFTKPIVLTGILSYEGRHHAHIRLHEVTNTEATFFIDESHACDGRHKVERTDLLIFESDAVVKSSHGTLMTGTAEVMAENKHDFKDVTFPEPFTTDELVVLVTVQTHNGGHYVFPRVKDITKNGFKVHLDETLATDGWHMTETIGYIAATKGEYIIAGTTYLADVVEFGGLKLQEIVMPNPMPNMMVFGQIQSYSGAHPVNLRYKVKQEELFTMKMDEDQCGVGDKNHKQEEIGFFAVSPAEGTWGVISYHARTKNAVCPTIQCEDNESLEACKESCLSKDECTYIQWRHTGDSRCCERTYECDATDLSTEGDDLNWMVLSKPKELIPNCIVKTSGCGGQAENYFMVDGGSLTVPECDAMCKSTDGCAQFVRVPGEGATNCKLYNGGCTDDGDEQYERYTCPRANWKFRGEETEACMDGLDTAYSNLYCDNAPAGYNGVDLACNPNLDEPFVIEFTGNVATDYVRIGGGTGFLGFRNFADGSWNGYNGEGNYQVAIGYDERDGHPAYFYLFAHSKSGTYHRSWYNTSPVPVKGRDYHFKLEWTGSVLNFYIDGVSAYSGEETSGFGSSFWSKRLCHGIGGAYNGHTGDIKNLKIANINYRDANDPQCPEGYYAGTSQCLEGTAPAAETEMALAEEHSDLSAQFESESSLGKDSVSIYGLALIGFGSIIYGIAKNMCISKEYTSISDDTQDNI